MKKRIKDLRALLLGIEMNLKILSDDMDEINKKIVYLHKVKGDLIYNIDLHKSGKVITMIKEYKKSIFELKEIKIEISRQNQFKRNVQLKIDQKERSHEFHLDTLEDLCDKEYHNNVIPFSRGKNAKK